jgi:hypothetical protein
MVSVLWSNWIYVPDGNINNFMVLVETDKETPYDAVTHVRSLLDEGDDLATFWEPSGSMASTWYGASKDHIENLYESYHILKGIV